MKPYIITHMMDSSTYTGTSVGKESFHVAQKANEASVMIAPSIDGRTRQTAMFDGVTDHGSSPYKLILESVEQWETDIVWLRYKLKNVSMKLQAIAIMAFLTFMNVMAQETIKTTDMNTLELTQEWDKTFPQSDKVEHTKITFHNRYGITLAADLYKPKNVQGHLAAIAVSGPYGATKEQVSGCYAQTLAERGFLTIAFDPSYYGESGGTPRYLTSPEISTEDFSAAVDYLTSREDVDLERIGILGICGWGGFALNAAANDPRIKATVTSTMYDMSRVNANGYFDANDNADARYELRRQLNDIRTKAYRTGENELDGGVIDPVPEDAPQFVKDYHDYYKTKRGHHHRSPNSNNGISKTSVLSFINMPLLTYIGEIRSAVLMIHGEKAHSRYFSEDAYKRLTTANKELLIIPGANHVDLYDNLDVVPFDRIEDFLKKALEKK